MESTNRIPTLWVALLVINAACALQQLAAGR